MPTNWSSRIEITSTTNPDKKYILAWNADEGKWGCGCPAWRFVKHSHPPTVHVCNAGCARTCKHVRAIEGLRPDQLNEVERNLQQHNIGTSFGRAIEEAKKRLLATGYAVEDMADELRLQEEAELEVGLNRRKV